MKQEHPWEQSFLEANPTPPHGFAERHDALLNRLVHAEKKSTRRSAVLRPLIAFCFLLFTFGTLAAGNILGLGNFFRSIRLGNPASVERLEAFKDDAFSFEASQDDVHITIHELIADGRWIYASAMLEPLADDVLLVPFGETGERPYGLIADGDTRSYQEYARDKGLRLIDVSIYLESTALSGDYFMEHAYDAQGRLMLYMGGETLDSAQAEYSLRIMTHAQSGKETDQSYPLAVQVKDHAISRIYPANLPVGDTGIILKEARLTLTALCGYLDITLEGESWLHADLMKDGDIWPQGLSMSVNGYEMDELPDKIDLRLEHPSTGQSWEIKGLKGK
ncbi:MAG: hypothetical protein ACOX58_12895 [Christensenellales bacterium]|jgi:hypothetical protein